MAGVRSALLLSTGERYAALVLNFATLAIVSRLLTPEEVGVSVVGMAVVGMAMSAREFASGGFLIQRHNLTQEDVRVAFTVMAVLTAAIAATLAALAAPLADVYGEERLVAYLRVISIALVIEVVATQTLTLLRREMRFGPVAAINVGGALTATATTIILANLGFSYMSFAFAWLASAIAMATLSLALADRTWSFRPRFRGWRDMLAFGGLNGATVVLARAYEAVPYLMLGRVVSLDAAALFSRGMMVSQLPDKIFLSGAVGVALPAFAAEARDGGDLKAPYLRAITLVTGLQWPALAMVALLAGPIVGLLLGPQWTEAVPIVRIVALALLFSFSFELNYPVLVAVGALRDVFLRALIVFPICAAVMAGASLFGLRAVALSLLFVVPFHALVSFTFVRRRIGAGGADVAAALKPSALLVVATVAGPLALLLVIGPPLAPGLTVAAAAVALAAAGWLAGLAATGHPLGAELRRAAAALLHAARASIDRRRLAATGEA